MTISYSCCVNTLNNSLQPYYIAREDLKAKYRAPKRGLKRIRAYSKAIEKSSSASIDVQSMPNGTVKFVLIGRPPAVQNALNLIQGEFINQKVKFVLMFLYNVM